MDGVEGMWVMRRGGRMGKSENGWGKRVWNGSVMVRWIGG